VKLFYLSREENTSLQKQLRVEQLELEYLCFVNELMFSMNTSYQHTNYLKHSLLTITNKVFLDALFHHVTSKTTEHLCALLANQTFAQNVQIRPGYTSLILEAAEVSAPEDTTELDAFVSKRLYYFINRLYKINPDEINAALLKLFEYMYQHFYNLDVMYYKFELMDFQQPMLFVSEKLNNANDHNYRQPHQEHHQLAYHTG
jgi:hypothetical protein